MTYVNFKTCEIGKNCKVQCPISSNLIQFDHIWWIDTVFFSYQKLSFPEFIYMETPQLYWKSNCKLVLTIGGGQEFVRNQQLTLRWSHELLIPSVPLAGWDVAFVAQVRWLFQIEVLTVERRFQNLFISFHWSLISLMIDKAHDFLQS